MNNEYQITLLENEVEILERELEYISDRKCDIKERINIINNIIQNQLPLETREFLAGFN